ncbi:uncharacterized protein PHACADRAFT_201160 [Phanerochaete carnosa HHB-10118-sp]|uniref:Malate dehydrogenase n=1 Tax=Phanerochaete carnosa (strain HHB-10118-sp) TaxID=650164 RepID=K5VU78_PHACS|nr:uncharacterized protein PHACADRAFT_201160 [Phanerochaete carnosa HHB-10118-sp]EKM50320.1 hypothetical protein PHACADRAFT_201160 [Phanerochaete carnosa HHB-10118-sp]
MYAFTKLVSALSLVAVANAFFTPEARHNTPATRPTGGSICSTKQFILANELPADINDHGGEPLPKPNSTYPVYTTLSVGMQNYTCGADSTWGPLGGYTFLFDISCLPQAHHAKFTSFVAALWDAAPPTVANEQIIDLFEQVNPGTALGLHYWIPDPNNATSGKINAVWDFTKSERYVNDTNRANAFLVAAETGIVPDPNDSVANSPWLYEPILYVDGKKDGQLADEVYRFNSNGGAPPNNTCPPGSVLQVKSTLNFWLFGGAWENTIF